MSLIISSSLKNRHSSFTTMAYDDGARYREQVGLLIGALGSDHSSTRHIAIAQLSLMGKQALPYLLSAYENTKKEIENPDSGNRGGKEQERIVTGIISILGIIGDPSAVPVIAKELPRKYAMQALSKIANAQALNEIIWAIPGLDMWNTRYGRPVTETGVVTDYDSVFLSEIFTNLGEKGIKALIQESKKASPEQAIYQIASCILAGPNEIPLIVGLLDESKPGVFQIAVKTLRRIHASAAVPKLSEIVLRSSTRVGGYDEAIKMIAECGTVDDWVKIRFAKKDFATIEHLEPMILKAKDKALPLLKNLMEDPDKAKQMLAIDMIRDIKAGKTEQSRVMRY